jgi:hypothetical protein
VWKLVGFALVIAACGAPRAFHCDTDFQCVSGSVPGRCEANGFCSFPDVSCASGSRFGEYAPDGVRGACVAPPTNAMCDATEALELGTPHDGTLRGASASVSLSCSPLATGDVFYGLDLAECSDLTVRVQADGGNLAAAVLTDCTSEVGCADAHPGSETETLELDGVPAGSYEIAVAGVSYDDAFTVTAEVSPAPNNTSALTALPIAPNAHLVQSLAGASDVAACGSRIGGRDLFYSVTLPALANGSDHWTLSASVTSKISTDFAVSLSNGSSCLAAAAGPASFRELDPGTYVLAVDGPTDGSCDHFTLDLSATETPPNDLCTAPTPVGYFYQTPVTKVVQLDNATNDYVGSCGGTGGDVVYSMYVQYREHVRITVTDTAVAATSVPVVYVRPASATCDDPTETSYRGIGSCDPSDPTLNVPDVPHDNACAKGTATAVLDLADLAAGQYLIVVDTDSGGGAYDLTVERIPVAGDQTPTTIPGCSGLLDSGCCDLGTTIDANPNVNTLPCETASTSQDAFRQFFLPKGCDIGGTFTLVSAFPQDLEIRASGACTLSPAPACAMATMSGSWYTTTVTVSASMIGVGGCNVIARVVGAQAQGNFALGWKTTTDPLPGCP